ncbi:uncharacterized protein DFL_007960 [Arthrobotrys flagrans]|uniref:Uncharacterized protein n=1 Tax=Arthrobotrys flagrans TaxID=97331 RepID=A0A436ZXV9_ARTFL|nr:hypothetical protein DFL_007960 [Arthrobotrys flagrans]
MNSLEDDALGKEILRSPPSSFDESTNLSPRPSDEFNLSGSKVRHTLPPPSSYPHPLDGKPSFATAITYKETYIRSFSAAVRNKPGWTEKILDKKLFTKWLREAQEQAPLCDGGRHRVLTWDEDDVCYVHDELVNIYKPFVEGLRERGVRVEPDVDGVWREDGFGDEGLRMELVDAVATLENIPEDKKDWHPGSDKQVLDLVHPSLWPIIYGRTISSQTGEPIRTPASMESDITGFSNKFCWLPSEFEVSPDGTRTTIKSYINNLASSSQKSLFYPILERIFTKFIPLFNHVLGDLRTGKHDFRRVFAIAGRRWWNDGLIRLTNEDHKLKWDKLLDQFINDDELNVNFLGDASHVSKRFDADGIRDPEFEGCDDSDDEDLDQRGDPGIYEVRDNMGQYLPWNWEAPNISEDVKLEGKTSKVIVKLANIVLTPDKPIYKGGNWHVEAMLNERIVATGIYYYDQENVTDSRLAFRRTVGNVPNWEGAEILEQHSDWPIVFNMSSESQSWAVQEIGQIETKKNRAIAFPNIYQHQVQPFTLLDRTKPGYRKILVFFLCDPSNEDLPTTGTVAPQQPEFRVEIENMLRKGPMGKMPEEVFRMVSKMVPEVMGREEAERGRKELMRERASFGNSSTMVQGLCYSLCEH